jgi:hypothetical protein
MEKSSAGGLGHPSSTAGPLRQQTGESTTGASHAAGKAFLGALASLVAPTVLASLNPAQRVAEPPISGFVASPPLHGRFDDEAPEGECLTLPGPCYDSIREDARLGR